MTKTNNIKMPKQTTHKRSRMSRLLLITFILNRLLSPKEEKKKKRIS